MRNIYSFDKSVIGYSHIKKGIVCQDYSLTHQNPQGKYSIAVVSDGHGDPDCFRSNLGSEFACNIALESLKNFAEEFCKSKKVYEEQVLENLKNNPTRSCDSMPKKENTAPSLHEDISTKEEVGYYGKLGKGETSNVKLNNSMYKILTTGSINVKSGQIRYLTDNIISKWYIKINEHYNCNPPTSLEREKSRAYADLDVKIRVDEIPHIYGATLICALWIDDFLLLIQQGDGGCTVFYENDEIRHPIPEDEKCQGNITTSLCGADSPNEIRHCILDLSKPNNNVIGVFLGSDGVEDSFLDVKGNDIFYKELMFNYFSDYKENHSNFIDYLDEYLPKLSKSGSADDMSVVGLIECDEIRTRVDIYEKDVDTYFTQQKYDFHHQKVVSMERKYNFLKDNLEDLSNKISLKNDEIQKLEKEIKDLEEEISNPKSLKPNFCTKTKYEILEQHKEVREKGEKLNAELLEINQQIIDLQISRT